MNIEKKDKELFNVIASKYAKKDTIKSCMIARQHQVLFAMKPLLNTGKKIGIIVDVGCGIGTSVMYLKGCFEKYIGIDQSEKIINIAKLMYKDNNIDFIRANIKNLDSKKIADRIADVILFTGALHHMTELNLIMKSLKRVAKPGAIFVAIEPQKANPLIQLMRKIRKKLDPSYSKQQIYFSKNELEQLLISNGIQLLNTSYQGYFSPLFAQIILKPQIIFVSLCRIAIHFDNIIEKYFPNFIKKFSWNLVIIGKFP